MQPIKSLRKTVLLAASDLNTRLKAELSSGKAIFLAQFRCKHSLERPRWYKRRLPQQSTSCALL
jgi:hypothetical protein